MARAWTTGELKKAAELWRAGKTMVEIAEALDRSRESIRSVTVNRRETFPLRKEPVAVAKPVKLRMTVSPFLHRAIKDAAKRQNKSMNTILRAALRKEFLSR